MRRWFAGALRASAGKRTVTACARGRPSTRLAGRRVLMLAPVWPERTTTAAGLRTWSLAELFVSEGCDITFVSPARDARGARRDLEAAGARTAQFQPNDSAFDAFVGDLDPSVAVFDRFTLEEMFGWRVRRAAPECLRVLDTQDLHFLRRSRQQRVEAALERGGEPDPRLWDNRSVEAEALLLNMTDEHLTREMASILRSDLTLLVSPFEQALLSRRFQLRADKTELAPFFYESSDGTTRGFNQRRPHFVTIGNFRHAPNVDSVRWLRSVVWPRVRDQLSAPSEHELHVYGAFAPADIVALSCPSEGFVVRGAARDQYETLSRYRCMLAPLRFGAGIKGKIADAWCVGTPVVTTPIGAEGMHPEDWNSSASSFGGAVDATVDGMAAAAARLVEDETQWSSASARGVLCVREMFDAGRGRARVVGAIEAALDRQAESRRENWMQAMLFDDFHRSVEYKSRYIEAVAKARDGGI